MAAFAHIRWPEHRPELSPDRVRDLVAVASDHAAWILTRPAGVSVGMARLELFRIIWWVRALPHTTDTDLVPFFDALDDLEADRQSAIADMAVRATAARPGHRFDLFDLGQTVTSRDANPFVSHQLDTVVACSVGTAHNGMPKGLADRFVHRKLVADAEAEPTHSVVVGSVEALNGILTGRGTTWCPNRPHDAVGLLIDGDTPAGRVVLSGPALLLAAIGAAEQPPAESDPTAERMRVWVTVRAVVPVAVADDLFDAWVRQRLAGRRVDPVALLAVV